MTGMETNVSSTVVPTCKVRNTSTSSEMLRCSPTLRNRGHRSLLNRPAVITPSSTLAVSSSSVTSPAARVAYHMPGPCRSMTIMSRCRFDASAGQPATVTAVPSWRTSRAGRPSPASQATAPSPRRIAAVLAVFASTQVAAATLTARQHDRAGSPWRAR